MRNLIVFLFLFIITEAAEATCNTGAIIMRNESGFGISFGGGSGNSSFNNANSVNVPLSINGEQACYKKINSIKMSSEKKNEKPEENNIIISPMEIEFENVPNAHMKQYIFVEKNLAKQMTKFHTMSFVCAGEIPLSIDTASNFVFKITAQNPEISIRTHFATGVAASNLGYNHQAVAGSVETYEAFAKLYQNKTQNELKNDVPCCNTYNVPSILSSTSIKALSNVERSLVASFTTLSSKVPNGCSNDFIEVMSNYQLENYSANESLNSFKIKKKWFSKDLVFEWNE